MRFDPWANKPTTASGGEAEVTDAPLDGPEQSPDLLAPPPVRGEGVRRLNKKPILIAGGAAVMTLGVLVYSMNERAEAQRAPTETEAAGKGEHRKPREGAPTMAPEVLDDAPVAGVVPEALSVQPVRVDPADPYAPPPPGNIAVPALAPASAGAQLQGAVAAGPVSPYEDQWRQYEQARAAQRQARFERANAALTSDMRVDGGGATSAGGSAAGAVPAGNAGYLAAALANLGAAPAPAPPPAAARASGLGGTAAQPAYYSAARLETPLSATELKAGTVIPAVLIGGLNSELPGQIVGQVTRNVFDSTTGRFLLIPQGAKVVGEYDSEVVYGQARVQVAWKRLILPDGSSFDLGKAPGVDRQGYAGFRDKVNNHYGRAYGSAFMVSLFSAGIQLSQPQAANGQNITAGQTTAAAIGQQMGQLGAEQARRNLNIKPELQIRPGYRFNISVTEDLILREWRRR